jgi:hypothetical protein
MMLGIADVPVDIIGKLKARVNGRRTPSSGSPTSTSDADLSHSTPRRESAGSDQPNLTEASTIDDTNSDRSDEARQIEEPVIEPHIACLADQAHNINICAMAKARHPHLMNPKDRASNKILQEAEQDISNFAITVMRSPMDFFVALARGFHNAPKNYGDDTVRQIGKVNDFKSGVAVAGTEFGLEWYDGITGVATQPYRGARKNGAKGFLAGIGKGVSGLILKPSAGKGSLGFFSDREGVLTVA